MSEVEDRVRGDVPPRTWHELGLWSLDNALGFKSERGLMLRSVVELYGDTGSGKSTLGYDIAGTIAKTKDIWLADLETTANKEYIEQVTRVAGHTGIVQVANYAKESKGKLKPRSHEEQVQDVVDALMDDNVMAGIIDSLGAFVSVVAAEKDVGERTVGQGAMTIGDFTGRACAWLRIADDPKVLVYVNHTRQRIGGHGFYTPGGSKKGFLANVRLWIRRIENDVPEGTGNFISEVQVQKLKAGGTSAWRKGIVYFIPGFGVSREMTAVFDCVNLEIAKREAFIKIKKFDVTTGKDEWVSVGRLGDLAQKALEPEKHVALFANFSEALAKYEQVA